MNIEKFLKKILQDKNPKTKYNFTEKEINDYIFINGKNRYSYFEFWKIIDYLIDNNLIK